MAEDHGADQAQRQKDIILEWASKPGRPDRWDVGFAPDFTLTVIGSSPISGTMVGVAEIDEKMAEFRSRLASLKVTIDQLICEGDTVVKLAHSEGVTVDGKPYRNVYSTVYRFEDGLVVEITEFLDTTLVETAVFNKKLVAG